MTDYHNIWKADEIRILRKYYISAPQNKLQSLLPNRSWNAIHKKASSFGLIRGKGEEVWSDTELAILIDCWQTSKPRYQIEHLLPNRTWRAIGMKAYSLGLRKRDYERPIISGQKVKADISIKGDRFRFGIVSDTHFASRYAQISYLHQFYKLAEKEGCETILHAGDISEGSGKHYRGQLTEMHLHGADNLKNFIVKNYPKFKGKTRIIAGGHDLDLWKDEGYDLLKQVASERDDIEYLGMESVTWEIGGRKINIVHPSGGQAYAISYRAQKITESYSSENKPHILILGHYHKAFYLPLLRNVYVIGAAGFQAQTPFAIRRNLAFHYGGWIATMFISKHGISSMRAEFIPFYKVVEDDFRNFE